MSREEEQGHHRPALLHPALCDCGQHLLALDDEVSSKLPVTQQTRNPAFVALTNVEDEPLKLPTSRKPSLVSIADAVSLEDAHRHLAFHRESFFGSQDDFGTHFRRDAATHADEVNSVGGDIEDLASESGREPSLSMHSSPRLHGAPAQPRLINLDECFTCRRSDCPSLHPPPGFYSVNVIASHCVPGDVWIYASGIVYDVSRFLKKHPGGESALLTRARNAQDASQDYAFHSPHARKLWRRLAIGRVAQCPNEAKSDCVVM